jgi:hypothetical protein
MLDTRFLEYRPDPAASPDWIPAFERRTNEDILSPV